MALDFRQVQAQVNQLGENASTRQRQLQEKRLKALGLLEHYASDFAAL